MKRSTLAIAATFAVVAAAALALGAVYFTRWGDGNVGGPKQTATDGKPARPGGGRLAAFVIHPAAKDVPEFSFNGADGGSHGLDEWRGKAVLFNLWATWCAPCLQEMPALDRLQARLGNETFEVVAVSVDRSGFDKPKAFYEKTGISHLALYNDPSMRIPSTLGAVGMPTTILFDAEGREVGRMAGPAEWDSEEAVELIARALNANS